MGTLRVSLWQRVVVLHAPYGIENNGRALFYFILNPSIVVCLFVYTSPSLSLSKAAFSSPAMRFPPLPSPPTSSNPVWFLLSSLECFSDGQRSHCSIHGCFTMSLIQKVVCVHIPISLCFSFICLFLWLLWSKYIGYLKNMCRIHNSYLRNIILLLIKAYI